MIKKDEDVKKLQQQIEELTNSWKRALADYQNLEKRVILEKEDFVKFANAGLILKLLSLFDIFEKAQEHLKDKGLELAISEFKKVLKSEGANEIVINKGDKFNHNEMECLEVLAGNGENEGKVAEVSFKGYRLNDKLLRPAKVKVYKKEVEEKLVKEQVTQKGDLM